jgi:hypothetical protein
LLGIVAFLAGLGAILRARGGQVGPLRTPWSAPVPPVPPAQAYAAQQAPAYATPQAPIPQPPYTPPADASPGAMPGPTPGTGAS